MRLNLKLLSVGVVFFIGSQDFKAQTNQTIKRDSIKNIEEVFVQGYRTVTKRTAIGSTQQVKADVIETRANANALNVVQGQLAGVNVALGSGQPGAKPTITIRGRGSLSASSDPLYVIDGFPSNADNFRSINSYDIETFEVLKDPVAIAEYGNRGANGVIVIKTKRGSMGGSRMSVRYTGQTGVSMLQGTKYNIANSRELLNMEKAYGAGLGSTLTQQEIDANTVDTNWLKYFFRPSFQTSHNLSVENSGKNFSMYTSGGYLEQDGILQGTDLKRFSFRNNITGRSENQRFQYYFGLSAALSKNSDQPNAGTTGINQNPILGALSAAPYVSPSTYNGSSLDLYNLYADDGTLLYTPLFLIDKIKNSFNRYNETRIDANSDLSYKVLDGLTARLRTGMVHNSIRQVTAQYPNSFNMLLFSPTPGTPSTVSGGAFNGTEQIINQNEFLFSNLTQLEYKKSFDKHSFTAMANMEYNFSQLQNSSQVQTGLNPKTYVPGAGSGYIADVGTNDFYAARVSAIQSRLKMVSYFGSLDYDYDKKYGVSGTIRRDGTSRFNTGYNWGTFWSVGARWNVDQEAFMDNLEFVDMFKLRGSYGTVGNQRIVAGTIFTGLNTPAFLDIYAPSNNAYNGGLGYAIAFGSPDLRWETTKSYNGGVDFEFFNRRLRGSFDVYQKLTTDMFFDDPTAPILGTLQITRNTDIQLYNNGFEMNLAYDLVKSDNLLLTIKANGSINKQRVEGITRNGGIIASGTDIIQHNANGLLPFLPYVYHYIGVNPANGNLWFADANGNPTENEADAVRNYTKYNFLPKYQGGFGFDLDYKGFFANTLFTFVAGIQRFDYDLDGLYDPNNLGQFNVSRDLLDSWTPENTNASLPSFTAANKFMDARSDRFLVDASYLRFRNAQIGYKLPKEFLANTFVKDMSIFVQAENIYTWTKWRGFDPESNRASDQNQYPTPRIFTVGFDVKF